MYGSGNTEKGLTVDLYLSKRRTHIVGVSVCDTDGNVVSTTGKVPAER
jgi:hypothetical protein